MPIGAEGTVTGPGTVDTTSDPDPSGQLDNSAVDVKTAGAAPSLFSNTGDVSSALVASDSDRTVASP